MKLHLPTRLRAAVLACITAVAALSSTIGTGVVTVGSVTYVMAAAQAQAETTYNGVTYSGLIFDIATSASATFHTRQFTNFYDDGTGTWVESTAFAGNQNSYYDGATQMSISQNFWREKFGDGAGRFQTLRLTGAESDVYLETQFSPFTLGGVIAEAGDYTYTVGRPGGDCAITIQAESGQNANMTIAADTRLSAGVNINKNTITVASSGTWNIASGKTLTLARFDASGNEYAVAGGVFLSEGVTVTLAGSGTAVINATTTTLNQGASFNIGATSTLNLTGTVNVLNDSVVESDIPTETNGYSQMTGSATAVTIAEGGTLNADGVTWQLNGLAASYSNGVVSQSGESSKYYVNVDADLATALDTKTSDVIIRNGATFNITSHTGGSAGMIKGNVLVEEGSTLKLSSGDALGWEGANRVSVLTVENGATVNVNHGGNETFGGSLNLNGSLTGVANSKWDFFTNSSLTIGENAQASISVGQIRLRRAGTVCTMGAGSTLDISSQIINGAGGDGVLTVSGNGTFNLTGGASISNLTLRKGGENNISTTAATFTKFYLGGGTTNVNTTVNAGQVRLDENGSAILNINEGGVLNITGTNNDHSTDASLMLNHWGHTSTLVLNGGELNAETIDMHLSWDGTGVLQANAGTAKVQGISAWTHQDNQCRGKILLGSATEGSAKLIIGENGIGDFADQAVLKLGNGTLGASADWSLRYNTSHTESKAEFIATTETGTIIDTTKVGGEEGAGATITFENGTTGAGNMTVQGTGSLVLEGASDRTGNTTIAGGTLVAKEVSALGTGAVTVAGGTLVLDTEDTITLGSLAMTSGAIKLAGAEKLAVTGAVTLSGGTLDLTNLADIITGAGTTVLGTVGGDVTGGTIAVSGLDAGIISQYSFSVSKDGENLILTAADASSPLFWNGGDGNWSSDPADNGWGTTGDDESTGVGYAAGSSVTISGTEGGTITVSGEQTAASLTIAESGYTITRTGNSDSLTITGDLTVNEGVSAAMGFLPTLGEESSIIVNSGATLDLTAAGMSNTLFNTVCQKTTGEGLVKLKGGDNAGFNTSASNTVSGNITVTGSLWLNGKGSGHTITVAEGGSLTFDGLVTMGNSANITVDGGTLVAKDGIAIGHTEGNYPATLTMNSGSMDVTYFKPLMDSNTNTIAINGGSLTVSGDEDGNAFNASGTSTTVSISNATLTNGETDMAFNHGSTMTDATVTAKESTTITVGGVGMTTTIAKAEAAQEASLTTNGTVVLAGTTAISGATTVTSNGTTTIASLSAAEGSTLTTAGTGTTTITTGAVDNLVVGAATTAGAISVTNVSGTGTLTQTTGTALALTDGATLSGSVTIGNATAAGSVAKTGTGTVTTGDITGTSTALTVSGGTLSTGAVSGLTTVSVAQGATLASTGDVTATGAATINGTFNGSSLTATSITVAQGATLTSTGAVSATGDAAINGSLTAGTLTAANITVAEGATVGATMGMSTEGTLTLNDSITLGALTADTVSLAAGKTLNVTGTADITSLALGSVGETPALSFGSLTSSALAVDVAITTLHDYFDQAAEGTTSVTIATLGAASEAALSLVNNKGGGYDYSIALDSSNNIVISREFSGIVWDGTSGAEWGDNESWQGDKKPGATDNVSFIGNEGTEVTPNVTIAAGGVTAGSVSVTGSETNSADYTFAGGSLTASDLLVENGSLSIENETAFTSGTVEETGSLTVNDDEASLEVGSLTVKGELTIEDGMLTITDTLTAEDGATIALNGGMAAIETATTGSNTIVIAAPATAQVGTLNGEECTVQIAGALNVISGDIKKIEGIADGADTAYGDLTVGASATTFSLTPAVTTDVAIAENSDVQNLTVTDSGNLTTIGTLTVHGDLETAGNISAQSALTVNGDLTATSGELRANNLTMDGESATLDVSGAGTVVAAASSASVGIASVSVTDGGVFSSQGGNVTADTITVSGADSTLSANNAAITADSVTVSTGGAIATEAGTNLKSTIKTDSLTVTGADSAVKVKAVAAKTAGGTNTVEVKEGATLNASETLAATAVTVTGADSSLTAGSSTGGLETTTLKVQDGASLTALSVAATNATFDGTDTTAAIGYNGIAVEETLSVTNGAALAADPFSKGGDINAKTLIVGSNSSVSTAFDTDYQDKGDITVETLQVAATGSVTAEGTIKVTDTITGTAGSITAETLDLSGLTAAATIADLKADTITLSDFNMLTVNDSVSNVAGTGAAMVSLTLSDTALESLKVGDEKVVVALGNSVTGQGITLSNTSLAAINAALKAHGVKGEMETQEGKYVMVIKDNSFVSQLGTSENGKAGLALADAAAGAGVNPTGDMAAILQHLDELRTAGTPEAAKAGDKIGAALSGASVAAMGAALSGDVERQLKAIRNRTTVMGVNQAVVNEDMPYLNAWVNAEGDYRDISEDGTMPGYKMTSWGGTVGFDVDCTPSFTCGLAATAMYGDFTSKGEDKAEGDLNTYYVSAFARYAKHRWTHTFVATAGMADTSLDRTVEGVKVTGDSEGTMFGGMYEVGYVFALDKEATTCLQPIVNVSYTHTTLSGYDESGSDIALKTGDVEMNKLTVGVGARLQSVIGENIYNRSSLFEARALVKFDAGDRQGEVTNSFVKYAGAADAKSVETGAIGGEFGMGVTVPVGSEGGNIFMDASAEIRADYVNVNGTVGYRVNF